MIRVDKSHQDSGHAEVAVVSNPGVIRNFRVQVRGGNSDDWQKYRTFRQRADAESCVVALQVAGVSARLVDCDRCPAGR